MSSPPTVESTPSLQSDPSAASLEPLLRAAVVETVQHCMQLHAVDYRLTEGLVGLYATLDIRLPLPPMRGWPVSPDFAAIMVAEILGHRPRHVVEAGSGISTVLIGYALQKLGSGRAFALEHDPDHAARTKELVEMHGVADFVEVFHAPLIPQGAGAEDLVWYDIGSLPAAPLLDFLVVDGPPASSGPQARYPALPLLRDRMSPRCRVLIDDAARSEEQQTAKRWVCPEMGFGFVRAHSFDCEKGAVLLCR